MVGSRKGGGVHERNGDEVRRMLGRDAGIRVGEDDEQSFWISNISMRTGIRCKSSCPG